MQSRAHILEHMVIKTVSHILWLLQMLQIPVFLLHSVMEATTMNTPVGNKIMSEHIPIHGVVILTVPMVQEV